jgi:Tfp pilus assembly protein PilN
MNAVNLLPPDQRPRAFQPSRTQLIAMGAVALAGGLGYWGHSVRADADDARAALAAAKADQAQVDAELQRRRANGAGAAALSEGEAFVEGLSAGRVDGERLLRRVATVTPASVWYGNLILDASAADPAAAAGAAPTTASSLTLDGFTFSHTQVARLMARVWAVPGLGEPRLQSSKVELKGGREVVHFAIVAPLETAADTTATTGATTP